ncbi:MAG TPA: HAD hydrolase-like protein [bacterium]|nr:HAD hydrolase-like protein [bacterium]
MITTIILDADGIVLHREMYFSDRLSKDFGVPPEKVIAFFKKEFPLCTIGQADLKEELTKYIQEWNWHGTVDELIQYWFEHEQNIDQRIINHVQELKNKGIKCYLASDNEKYRTKYIYEQLGLKNYFDIIFSSSNIGFCKKQLEFWDAVHNQLGTPEKSSVLVLDDDQKFTPPNHLVFQLNSTRTSKNIRKFSAI